MTDTKKIILPLPASPDSRGGAIEFAILPLKLGGGVDEGDGGVNKPKHFFIPEKLL